jgi:hypothetical protein
MALGKIEISRVVDVSVANGIPVREWQIMSYL